MKYKNVFTGYEKKISSIILGNILTNIPRGFFNGVLYLLVLGISLPILNNQSINFTKLYNYYWIYLGAFVIYILSSIISSTNTYSKSYQISSDIRIKLGEKLRNLSLSYFKNNDPGDVTSRLLHDVSMAEETLSHHISDIISGIIIPLLIGGFLLFINSKLALILFLTVLFSMVFFCIASHIIKELGKKHLLSLNQASSRILEYTGAIKVLKAFNMTGKHFKELDKAMIKLKKLSFKSEVFTGIPVQIAILIMDFGYLFTIYQASILALNQQIIIAEAFSFIILGYYFFEPIKLLGISMVMLRHSKNSLDRIKELMKEPEPNYLEDSFLPVNHEIKFTDVDFRYLDNSVLKGLYCTMPEKKMTALVGLSGSGKTTITSLIARFWDTNRGKIWYGDTDINHVKPEILLQNISMVFQDVFLFNDTIFNNIHIGNLNASNEDVINAAKLAQCHEFINNQPEGYNTLVSEKGNSLSGGEKQRISIARAILKNAPVVLLDEATASLDPENEYEIQLALDNLTSNKTLIIIAHKFSSVVNADKILVLEDGKISEQGPHSQLINNNGLYKKLWELQQKSTSWKWTLNPNTA